MKKIILIFFLVISSSMVFGSTGIVRIAIQLEHNSNLDSSNYSASQRLLEEGISEDEWAVLAISELYDIWSDSGSTRNFQDFLLSVIQPDLIFTASFEYTVKNVSVTDVIATARITVKAKGYAGSFSIPTVYLSKKSSVIDMADVTQMNATLTTLLINDISAIIIRNIKSYLDKMTESKENSALEFYNLYDQDKAQKIIDLLKTADINIRQRSYRNNILYLSVRNDFNLADRIELFLKSAADIDIILLSMLDEDRVFTILY